MMIMIVKCPSQNNACSSVSSCTAGDTATMEQNFLHGRLFSPASIIPPLHYIIQYNIHVLAAASSGWNQPSFQGPTAYPSSGDDTEAVGLPKRRIIWTTWRACQPEFGKHGSFKTYFIHFIHLSRTLHDIRIWQSLILILLTWRIWWAHNNDGRWDLTRCLKG